MILNEDDLDRIAGKLVKKTGTDEPPAQFTDRVMQTVFALEPQIVKSKTKYFLWLLMVIPLLIAGGWYLSGFPEIINKLMNISAFIRLYFISVFTGLAKSYHHLSNISISPIVVIGSIAVFILLMIETFLTKNKYQV